MRVRVSWVGAGPPNHVSTWALGLFALLLGTFVFTRLVYVDKPDHMFDAERAERAGLVVDEMSVGEEPIRLAHSRLDIGQAKDIFDNAGDTLIRGLEANPFVLDFDFSRPQAVRGLAMDFGRMDFVLRVQVYGTDSSKPIFYQGEYRQQPDIPHIDMDFANGPEQVKRVVIEIEQLNPPNEVHIHVREVLFKQ